jgi:hypothetical protein
MRSQYTAVVANARDYATWVTDSVECHAEIEDPPQGHISLKEEKILGASAYEVRCALLGQG